MRKFLITACLFICIFYSYVLYAIFNPHVSVEYTDYYIHKTTDLAPSEIEKTIPIVVGRTYDYRDSNSLIFLGWHIAEKNHRWTAKAAVRVLFRVDDVKTLGDSPFIEMVVFPYRQQRAIFTLNGEKVRSVNVDRETQILLPLKREHFIAGLNSLRIELPDAQVPGNGESRVLALGMRSFALR